MTCHLPRCAGVSSEVRYRELLQEGDISSPDPRVLGCIVRQFASRLLVCRNKDDAVYLYEEAAAIPGSSTAIILLEQLGLRLNGPFSEHLPASILKGSDNGRPCIVKLLKCRGDGEPSTGTLHLQLGSEAAACEQLKLNTEAAVGSNLVHADVLRVHLPASTRHGPGLWTALRMPQYCCVLADMPQLPESAILEGGMHLKQAVCYMHNKGLIHMDIKVWVSSCNAKFASVVSCSVHAATTAHTPDARCALWTGRQHLCQRRRAVVSW